MRTILKSLALLTLVGAVGFGFLWHKGVPQAWFQTHLIESYLHRLEKALPFKFEKIEFKKDWTQIFTEQGIGLSLILKSDPYRIRLDGPLRLTRVGKKQSLAVEYVPEGTIEVGAVRSSPAQFKFQVLLGLPMVAIEHLHIFAKAEKWKWAAVGTDIEHADLEVDWHEDTITTRFSANKAGWTGPEKDSQRAVNIDHPTLEIKGPLVLDPITIGPEISIDWKADGGEVLWNDLYLDLPLKAFPIQANYSLEKAISVSIGKPKSKIHFDLNLNPPIRVRWNTDSIPLKDFAANLAALIQLGDLKVDSGSFKTDGEAQISPSFSIRQAEGALHINQLGLSLPQPVFRIKGLDLDFPFSSRLGAKAAISIDQIQIKKLKGKLSPTTYSFRPTSKNGQKEWAFQEEAHPYLPLTVDGVPIRIKSPQGVLSVHPKVDFHFNTAIDLSLLPVDQLAPKLCIHERIPPALLTLQLPKIEVTRDTIDPEGLIRFELFQGFVEVADLGFYDLKTDVPETDFELLFGNIRLDRLGEWLGFGEMDGVINGFGKEVTFQGWLPTIYDFRIEVLPLNQKKVVFSAQAMKNFVRLFAGDEIDNMPGIAKWLAFGWPGNLFGGYDVYYAGAKILSENGLIHIETLDPAKILEQERKHFILYGPRFKMPLQSSHYPLILDASTFSNYVHQMISQLGTLGKDKKEKPKDEDPNCVLD